MSEFRDRLIIHQAEHRLLDHLLTSFQERGWLKARGRQRSNSTHVLAAIRTLHRLENVGETLRQALNHLTIVAPAWLRTIVDPDWYERYGTRVEQYRLPKDETKRRALAWTFAADGYRLLEAIYHPTAPIWLREVEAVETLRRVWVQQFYRSDLPSDPIRWRGKDESPPSALVMLPLRRGCALEYQTRHQLGWLSCASDRDV